MRRTRRAASALFACAVLTLTPVAMAQQPGQPPPAVDLDRKGPKVGERVPAFSGVDQHGRTQTLESVLKADGAMLVFYRSADW